MELNEMINFVKENNKIMVTLSLTIFTSVIFPELKSWYSKIINTENKYRIFESSPDSCVKCYTMFLPFLLIKIDVFS
ncbi:hypothetical protein ACEY4S_11315, partial [Staphylococcus aureus]